MVNRFCFAGKLLLILLSGPVRPERRVTLQARQLGEDVQSCGTEAPRLFLTLSAAGGPATLAATWPPRPDSSGRLLEEQAVFLEISPIAIQFGEVVKSKSVNKAHTKRPKSVPPARAKRGNRKLIVIAGVAVIGISLWALSSRHQDSKAQVMASSAAPVFQPTITNRTPAPGKAPAGMVWIPGGEFSMGANDPPDMDDVGMKATQDARPMHRVYVDAFFMDNDRRYQCRVRRFVNGHRIRNGGGTQAAGRRFSRGAPGKSGCRIAWSSLRPIIRCRSTITSNGGAT